MSGVSRIVACVVVVALVAAPALAYTPRVDEGGQPSGMWASVWSLVSTVFGASETGSAGTEGAAAPQPAPADGQGSGNCDSQPIMDPNG
jgi:hypothetical protein